jgi:hypothetical protein
MITALFDWACAQDVLLWQLVHQVSKYSWLYCCLPAMYAFTLLPDFMP